MPYYRIDSRLQDEGWQQDTEYKTTTDLKLALAHAELLSRDPFYGMARVVDMTNNRVVYEWSAGHTPVSDTDLATMLNDTTLSRVERILAEPPRLNVMNIGTAQNVHIQQGNMPRFDVAAAQDMQSQHGLRTLRLHEPDPNPTLHPPVPETTRELRGIRVRPRRPENS